MDNSTSEQLASWYESVQGEEFLESLQQRLIPILQATFGFHAVQIGASPSTDKLLARSVVNYKIVGDANGQVDLHCTGDALPFDRDSVDLLLLAHSLELTENAHQVLREAERVLVPEGRLVLVGIDPWTMSSAWSRLRGRNIQRYSHGRVRDWLELLGLEIEDSHMLSTLGYHRRGWFKGVPKVAGILNLLESYVSGGYAIVAKKRVARVTPIASSWRPKPRLIAVGLSKQPAARNVRRNTDD